MFADTTEAVTMKRACHPLDMVMDHFKTEETAAIQHDRLKTFLEDALKVHGKPFEQAPSPATCLINCSDFVCSKKTTVHVKHLH